MFSWKEFEKTKEILSHVGGKKYHDEWSQHHLQVRPNELLDWMEFLKDDLGFFTLSELTGIERNENEFELVYNLLNMGSHQRLNLHIKCMKGEIVPSVTEHFPHADWMEREQNELLNLSLDKERPALLLPENQKNYPLKKSAKFQAWPVEKEIPTPRLRYNPNKSETPYPEESYVWKRFDLFSEATQGAFEALFCFDPVKLVDSKLKIGFHHQGLEYLFQSKDVFQLLELVDKINLSSAPNFSIAWAKTIEEMFRIKLPERAQAIRIVMLELARVADHLTVIASICRLAGMDESKLFINAREKVYELFEKFSGHRHGIGIARIGGVKEDLPHGWIAEYQSMADVLTKNLRLIHRSILGQVKFRNLLDGEPVNAQSVIQWGVGGPAMRAAGLNFDLRKSQPFYFYQDIDFDIPVGIHGTAYDRYLIRFEEIFQSLRIITQVIDNLPLGEFISPMFSKNILELHKVFETLEKPNEWHYSALETPNGEGGFQVQL
jgi:NADH-quinone oxidoreductase subunit C/D